MSPASALVTTHSSDKLAGYQLKGLEQSQGGKAVKNRKGGEKTTEIAEELKTPAKTAYLPAFLLSPY